MPFLDTGRPAPDPAAGGSNVHPRIVRLFAQLRAESERARALTASSTSSRTVSRTLDEESAEALSCVERLERRKARLEGRLLDAYAALHTVEEQQLARLTTSTPVPITAEQVAAQEIVCATGVGAMEVSRRLELALSPRRHGCCVSGCGPGRSPCSGPFASSWRRAGCRTR